MVHAQVGAQVPEVIDDSYADVLPVLVLFTLYFPTPHQFTPLKASLYQVGQHSRFVPTNYVITWRQRSASYIG